MLNEQFKNDWFSHPSYWFHPTHTDDDYLKHTYMDLLDNPIHSTLTDILIHDQLIRHVERHCQSNHILEYHLQIALNIHKQNDPTKLSNLEWCFWALPVRHSKDIPSIFKVLKMAWKRFLESKDPHLKRFLHASYQRMPMNQTSLLKYYSIPQSFESIQSYKPILDHCPIHPPLGSSNLESILKQFVKNHPAPYLLSLSGGVDSMVCSYVFKHLNIPFEAIYIDYCNRDVNEANFVKAWCGYMNIPLYIRSIHEIQRQPCMDMDMRNIYESYTRNVRYECYRTLTKKGIILLGHNQDDCFENILTNLCHQHKYEQLTGMTEFSQVDGISFGRPLLTIPKSKIYEEAKRIGIPYLKDSTPSWSQRGQIRDSVRPTLETWDPRMVPALFQLSERLQELSKYKETVMEQITINDIQNGFQMNYPIIPLGYNGWKTLLSSKGISIKHKSLLHFLSLYSPSKEFQCILSKSWKVLGSQQTLKFLENK